MKELTRWVLIILSFLIICILSFFIWKIYDSSIIINVHPAPRISLCINVNITLTNANISNSNGINANLFIQEEDMKISYVKVLAFNSDNKLACNSDYELEKIKSKTYNLSLSVSCPPNSFVIGETYIVKVAPKFGDSNQCEPIDGKLEVVAGE